MLKHRIDTPDTSTSAFCVVGSHDRLQDVPPIHRAFFIVGINLGQSTITACFDEPQFSGD